MPKGVAVFEQTFRKTFQLGGSVAITIPETFKTQNHIEGGQYICVECYGNYIKVKPLKLTAETDDTLKRVEKWQRKMKQYL